MFVKSVCVRPERVRLDIASKTKIHTLCSPSKPCMFKDAKVLAPFRGRCFRCGSACARNFSILSVLKTAAGSKTQNDDSIQKTTMRWQKWIKSKFLVCCGNKNWHFFWGWCEFNEIRTLLGHETPFWAAKTLVRCCPCLRCVSQWRPFLKPQLVRQPNTSTKTN